MKTFILIMIIMTSSDYKRGFGDGIAASKSASSAIELVKFRTLEACNTVKNQFLKMAGHRKTEEETRQISATCQEVKERL